LVGSFPTQKIAALDLLGPERLQSQIAGSLTVSAAGPDLNQAGGATATYNAYIHRWPHVTGQPGLTVNSGVPEGYKST